MSESSMCPFVSPTLMPVLRLVRGECGHPVWSSHDVETHFIFSPPLRFLCATPHVGMYSKTLRPGAQPAVVNQGQSLLCCASRPSCLCSSWFIARACQHPTVASDHKLSPCPSPITRGSCAGFFRTSGPVLACITPLCHCARPCRSTLHAHSAPRARDVTARALGSWPHSHALPPVVRCTLGLLWPHTFTSIGKDGFHQHSRHRLAVGQRRRG